MCADARQNGCMSSGESDGVDASVPDIRDTLAAAVARLAAQGVRDEGLGLETPARRVLGIPLRARITPAGRVWRLGVLLLSADGDLLATGDTLRASAEVRRGYTAESARGRAQQSATARRGGFAEGEVVNVGWQPIDVDAVAAGAPGAAGTEVVRVHDGAPQVCWNPRDRSAWVDLASYLDDRIRLLAHPPGSS